MKRFFAIICFSVSVMSTQVIAQTDSTYGNEIPGLELRELGESALAHGFYQEASNYFTAYHDKVSFFEPLRIEAKLLLIKALTLKGDYNIALTHINALKKKEKIASYILEMAELRVAICIGDKQNTLTLLNQLSQQIDNLKGEDFVTYLMMWIMYYETQSNWEMALLNAKKLETYAQENKILQLERRARFQRIYFLTKMGSTTLAESQIAMLKPENESELCEADLLRSLIYLANNNIQGALDKYEIASKLPAFKKNQLVPVISRDLATSLIAQRRYKEAEPLLNNLYMARENDALQREALRRIIDLHVLANEQEQSILAIERYLNLYPEANDVSQRKLQLLQLLINTKNQIRTVRAFKTYYDDKTFKKDEKIDLLRMYARYLQSINQNEDAIIVLKEIQSIATIPSIAAEALFQLGELYYILADYTQAIDYFKKSIEASSDWKNQSTYMLMMSAIEQKDYSKAMSYNKDIEEDHSLNRITIDALYFKAFLNEQLGDSQQAKDLYQNFVDSYPQHLRANNAVLALGEILVKEGALDSSRFYFESILKNYPESSEIPRAKYQLVYSYSLLGVDSKALLMANELVENHPNSEYALEGLNFLADYSLAHNNYEQALITLDKLLSMNSILPEERVQAMYDKSKIYMDQKRYKEAVTVITATENIECSSLLRQKVFILYADILCKQKNYLLATMTYQMAYNLSPLSIYGTTALARMGDSLFVLYSADEEVNERYLKEARACYMRVLNTPQLPLEMAEQTYWKIGHAHHLQRHTDLAMSFFMRPLLLRTFSKDKTSPNQIWLIKCAHSALSILRRNLSQGNGTKAIKICDMMVEFDHKNSVFWQRIKGEIQSEFKWEMLPLNLKEVYPIDSSLILHNPDSILLDSLLQKKKTEILISK